jgi:4-amino-4-deoxy-L-arabinose transferase-like glycosyltransferase
LRRAAIFAALFAGSALLFHHQADRPLDNGDEAVYAQMAVEMAQGGGVWTLHWQGRPVLTRPPASVWPMALCVKLFGASESVLRWPLALEAALAVALLYGLGSERYGWKVGWVAALLLATADNLLTYARYIESEPLLCACVLGAFFCWERGRTRPLWIFGWGACMAGALFTKQIVGALPLLAPLADLLSRRPLPRRPLAFALALTAMLCIPWFCVEWIRFGREFVEMFLIRNVWGRSVHSLHRTTTPFFYVSMLWRREGMACLVLLPALAYAALRRDGFLLLWALGVLVPFSLVASRFSNYALLAYPALALLLARPVVELARGWLAVPLVVLWALPHLLGGYSRWPASPDLQSGLLARRVAAVSRADDVLLVVDQVPYAARFYGRRRTIQVAFEQADYDEARFILPAEIERVDKLGAVSSRFARWFAIVPKVRSFRLETAGKVYPIEQTGAYILVANLPSP